MTKKAIRQRLTPGQTVTVTNHYIDRVDHPCFGTRQRTIERITSSHLWFTETGGVEWPKAAQITAEGNLIRLYGGGCGQKPTDLFLTIAL